MLKPILPANREDQWQTIDPKIVFGMEKTSSEMVEDLVRDNDHSQSEYTDSGSEISSQGRDEPTQAVIVNNVHDQLIKSPEGSPEEE